MIVKVLVILHMPHMMHFSVKLVVTANTTINDELSPIGNSSGDIEAAKMIADLQKKLEDKEGE